MGELTGFILVGHSFGGFVSGHYAVKYPQHIKKLLMLSPFGVPKRTFNDEEFDAYYDAIQLPNGKRKPPKFLFGLVKKAWKKKWSPFGILRKSGICIQNIAMKRFVSKRINGDLTE